MDTPERVLVGQNLLELTVFETPTVRLLAEKLSPADQTTFSTLGRDSDSGPALHMFSLMLGRRPRPPTGTSHHQFRRAWSEPRPCDDLLLCKVQSPKSPNSSVRRRGGHKSPSADGIDRAPRRSPVVRFAFTGTNVLKSNAGRILIPGGEGPVRCRLPGRLASK
jgi:hypothetical protein